MRYFKSGVKMAVGSVPIARALTKDSVLEGIDTALMDTYGVSAGVAMMFFNVFQDKKTDMPGVRLAKMYGTMIAGMAAGMLAYNVLKTGVVNLANKYKAEANEGQETERLLTSA